MHSNLVSPHGDILINLVVNKERSDELKNLSRDWPSWDLTPRQICDLELLANGGFSPLDGFLCQDDYISVCEKMRLTNGIIWPIPIMLDVTEKLVKQLDEDSMLALRDAEGVMLAALKVEQIWRPDITYEAKKVFNSTNTEHPGVAYLNNFTNPWYVGGKLEVLQLPYHYDFVDFRLTPAQLREKFASFGWHRVIAFQTRNPMHRAHQEITFRAAKEIGANLLIHPVVGMTKPGDVDHYTRVRCYMSILKYYPHHTAMMSLLPLAMRMGGPREALWHAIIRKNYGCTDLIVGRDHAGPGSDSSGKPFYGPYDAQELLQKHEQEIGIKMVPFKMMTYVPDLDEYMPIDEVPKGTDTKTLSGTDLRKRLATGHEIPSWFSFSEVIEELRQTYPPRSNQGFTVFFTGLPSSGKSTLANVLLVKLLEAGGRPVTLLDGDIVRKNLSSELGFSKEHRNLNIQRIGFVAAEITKNRGIAICAPIAPYDNIRKQVRQMVEAGGGFILVHVSTPVEVCEQRDRKGLYAKARAGIIKEFTGISDPYEEPDDADLVLDTTNAPPEECVQNVILYIEKEGYIAL
ncbi:MAG: bifunctional sulfate adenylyltransferase/adenylylsulfate kinase [Sedimentisphaerales bacterium]|nr:bifunctional sulfate adenylyltransferase/adenylylsulfate kinase [Sedimentisphaerales bacterium]